MCGRTAQTYIAVSSAGRSLGVRDEDLPSRRQENHQHSDTQSQLSSQEESDEQEQEHDQSSTPSDHTYREWTGDNCNLSPGMETWVIFYDDKCQQLRMKPMKWGLIPRVGLAATTTASTSIGMHFQMRMFNARTDTLFEKSTFASLLRLGRTCIVALDGFYEWKTELKQKQPYYLVKKSKQRQKQQPQPQQQQPVSCPHILLAGLWTAVPIINDQNYKVEEEMGMLETFTILTTQAAPALQWLHTRMPVMVESHERALEWLTAPHKGSSSSSSSSSLSSWTASLKLQKDLVRRLEMEAQSSAESSLDWYAVTSQMNHLRFRSAVPLPPLVKYTTLHRFFLSPSCSSKLSSNNKNKSKSSRTTSDDDDDKESSERTMTTPWKKSGVTRRRETPDRALENKAAASPIRKKPKMGTIDFYFTTKDSS